MIGMPTYGRSFTLVDPTKFDIGAPASGGGAPGKYTGEAGFMSYYEVIAVTLGLVWFPHMQQQSACTAFCQVIHNFE